MDLSAEYERLLSNLAAAREEIEGERQALFSVEEAAGAARQGLAAARSLKASLPTPAGPEPRTCSKCGQPLSPQARFCKNCGAAAEERIQESGPEERWALIGAGMEDPLPLIDGLTLGRAAECDLQLQDPKISRQHARIEQRDDGFWLADLGSSNGVLVNGRRIFEPVQLADGDQIVLGDTRLEVAARAEPPAAAATLIDMDRTVIQQEAPPAPAAAPPREAPVGEGPAQPTRTCPRCGKALSPTARFCGSCGYVADIAPAQPPPVVQTPPPPPPAAPQPTPQPAPPTTPYPAPQPALFPAETILAALPVGTQRSGFLGARAEGFVLVLSDQRILVTRQTAALMKENARQAKEAARQSGKGFLGQWGAAIGSNSSQRYLGMSPEEILNETAGNTFIYNSQVRSVKIKESYDPEQRSEVKLTLQAVNVKLELIYTQSTKKQIQQALRVTLGDLVR